MINMVTFILVISLISQISSEVVLALPIEEKTETWSLIYANLFVKLISSRTWI